MRAVAWRWLPFVTFATFLLPGLAAAGGMTQADARAWLARIHAAASQGNYQGTLVFTAGGMLSSSHVAHFSVGEQTYERVEALDGRQQRIYRLNDTVHTLWPQPRVAVVEKRSASGDLPSATQAVEPRALDHYDFQAENVERVAGREAQVLLLKPRDELRYTQRLWADKATGLMLRADVIGAKGQVLESTAFSEVEVGVKPQPETAAQIGRRLEGYRIVRPTQQRTELESEGWTLAHPVSGFWLASCVRRTLESADQPGQPVLQAMFSDGLTHVSLFVESVDAARPAPPELAQIGATATLRQRRGDQQITVMGDVPPATLRAFAEALERRR